MTATHTLNVEYASAPQKPCATVTRLTPQSIACQVCDVVGGCLAEKMLESHRQPDRALKNNRGIKAGEHIFRESDESNALYVVRSGSVKSYLISNDGEEQVLGFYLPGDVFGLDGSQPEGCMSSAVP